MTPERRIEMLEKQLAEQGEQIKELTRMFIHSAGADSAYQTAVQSLLVAAGKNEALDSELSKRMFELEATTIAKALTEEQVEGFDDAQEVITEARQQGQ
jgi:uncharacterized coiled-coil protein SlyX